jgi:hypothetical protein
VGDGVASLSAEAANGETTDAAVANGWFLFIFDRSPKDVRALIARDASGEVLLRLSTDDPAVGPMFSGL